MTNDDIRDLYDRMYSKPSTDSDAIAIITKVFQEKIGYIDTQVEDSISEVYRETAKKGHPAYYWMLEAIHRTSENIDDERTFSHMIGTLWGWMMYGFDKTDSDEEEVVYDYFAEITGLKMTPESRRIVVDLIESYGAFKVMKNILKLKEIDLSLLVASNLNNLMEERYQSTDASESATTVEEVVIDEEEEEETYSYGSKTSDQEWWRAIDLIVPFLKQAEAPVKTGVIVDHLVANNVTWMTKNVAAMKLASCGLKNRKIVSMPEGRGLWWHRDHVGYEY